MKVEELKGVIKDLTSEELRVIIIEIYKAIPKRLKEEKSIDFIIQHPQVANIKKEGAKANIPNLAEIEFKAEEFIEYAYKQYYFIPNQYVHKKDRPKWRFIAKQLYKSLIAYSSNKEDLPDATKLLEKLYTMLCYSCSYVLFNCYDPFDSIQITQTDFFETVISLKYRAEKIEQFIEGGIYLMINNSLNRNTLYEDLMEIILKFLKTPDLKDMAIAKCDQIRKELQDKPPQKGDNIYHLETKLQNLAIMGFLCHLSLYQPQEAIDYFKRYYKEKDNEITLYVLLRLLKKMGLNTFWKQEYELAIKNGIKPREALRKEYESNFKKIKEEDDD